MIHFGRLMQEEDLSIILLNNLKIYLPKWSLTIPLKDLKYNK